MRASLDWMIPQYAATPFACLYLYYRWPTFVAASWPLKCALVLVVAACYFVVEKCEPVVSAQLMRLCSADPVAEKKRRAKKKRRATKQPLEQIDVRRIASKYIRNWINITLT